MSRLARNPINIPEDIKVSMNDNEINFEGKLGKSSSTLPNGIAVDMKDNLLHFSGENKALLGTVYANVKNEIVGNSQGFEKRLELVGTGYKANVSGKTLVLSLGYIKLPNKLFGIDIPDQPRVDSTFAAGLLGNILGGLGISVNAAQGAKKKKKEEGENGVIGNSNGGTQTIIIKQPLEIVTTKPDVIKVDPTKK